jgi:hypothetical protein
MPTSLIYFYGDLRQPPSTENRLRWLADYDYAQQKSGRADPLPLYSKKDIRLTFC